MNALHGFFFPSMLRDQPFDDYFFNHSLIFFNFSLQIKTSRGASQDYWFHVRPVVCRIWLWFRLKCNEFELIEFEKVHM